MYPNMLRLHCLLLLLLLPTQALWFRPRTADCPLACQYGGVCQTLHDDFEHKIMQTAYYCHCPPYRTGPLCEIAYTPCPGTPGNSTYCPNGQLCMRDVNHDQEVYYHCACDIEQTDFSSAHARRTCQHAATVFCGDDTAADKPEDVQKSLGRANGAYCRNNGACRSDGACTCTTGWKGDHCEIPTDPALVQQMHYYDTEDDSTQPTAAQLEQAYQNQLATSQKRRKTMVLLCALVVVGSLSMVAYSVWDGVRDERLRRRRRRQRAARIPNKKKNSFRKLHPMEMEESYHD